MKLAAVAVLAALASPVLAEDKPEPKPPPKRKVPDYDGRAGEPTTILDGLLWVPRVVLFVPRVVIDYGVRWPFGKLVQTAEHSKGFRRFLRDFFREVENANPLIFPVVLVDFGFKPSVGARVLWRRGYLVPKSDVTLRVGTGGIDWWRADVGIKSKIGALRTSATVGASDRPDYLFYGVGRDTPNAAKARYAARKLFARGAIGGHIESVGEASLTFGVGDTELGESNYGDEKSIDEQVAAGNIAAIPAGYEDDYRTARVGAHVTLDSRFDGKRARSGVRFDVGVDRVYNTTTDVAWTKLELVLGGSVLLDPVAERKLDVRLGVEFIEPDRDADVIPFPELPTIAGGNWLRGLSPGRIYGESAFAFLLDYNWPLAAWLDAHAHLGVGNVFDDQLDGFSLGRLRGSFGGALTVAGLSERQIGVSLHFGTEPLGGGGENARELDFDVTNYRLILEYSGDY